MRGEQIGAKCTGLKGDKPRRCSRESHIRCGFALKHLADKHELSALISEANTVSDHALAEHRRKLRCEIAHLIGMWEEDQVWLRRFDDLLERDGIAVRSVILE